MCCTYLFLCVMLVSWAAAQSSTKTFIVASGTPPDSYIGTLDASGCRTQPLACQTLPCSTYLSTDLRFFYNSSGLLLWTSATLNVSRISMYIVTFTCFPQFTSDTITLTGNITVVDTSVHPPQFSASWANLTVAEDAPLGSAYAFASVTATSTSLSAVYVISGNLNDAFTVSYQPPTDANGRQVLNGTYVVSLVLSGVLQYAEVSSYQLMVVALDSSAQPLSANISVQVNVQPANLNSPVFAQSVYFAKLNETAPIGQTVLTVSASDIDFGLNGQLIYSINSQFNAQLAALFSVNPQSGLVTLSGSLLSSSVPSAFEIVINAQDLAPVHPLSASCVVIITVARVSATRPVLSAIQWLVNTSTSSSTSVSANALIPTGISAGTPIALLTIVRSDTLTAVSPITVTASPSSFSVSQLAPSSFQLLLASAISSVGSLSIVINAASSLDVTSVQFSLQATVVASSTPTFLSRLFIATVDDTFVSGSYIVQLNLNWTAATSTQSVRFMLNNTWLQTSSGNVSLSSGSPFGVDANTGWIKLLSPLPCTAASSYLLLVTLTDATGYTLDSTMVRVTAVTAAVTPADAPWFSAPFYNEAPTQSTFCLTDIMAYTSANCNASLSYAAVNASSLPFNLMSGGSAPVCGSLAASPNYPIVSDWYLQATDGAGRASTALVRLTVPSPSSSWSLAFANANLTLHVGALESTGTLISPLTAVYGALQSQPTYTRLVYSVLSRNDPLLFALGRYNGWLTVANTPGSLLSASVYPARFSLQLAVNDALNNNTGSPTTVVTVVVHNESSDTTGWQRLFSQRVFFFSIRLDAAVQQTIGTVSLTTTAFVTLQNNPFVACNVQTGTLSVSGSLVSAPSWLVLQLTATTSNAHFDSAVVAIQLLPASSSSLPQPTVITPSGTSVTLALRSDTPVGRLVYTALAFDPLAQTAASYSLVTDSSGAFQLDSTTGMLSLASPLSAGLSSVSLTISASVGLTQTSTVRTASLTIQLSVLPCNAYSPTLTSATYSQSGFVESVVSPVAANGPSLNVVFSAAYLQSSLGKPVAQFAFNDSDTVLRNQLSLFSLTNTAYSLQSNMLDLDVRTGSLYVVSSFALAAVEQSFSFVLCAANSVPPVFAFTGVRISSSCAALQVTVINDAYWPAGPPLRAAATVVASAPVFSAAVYQLAVYENTAASSAQPVKIGRVSVFAPNSTFASFTLLNYSTLFRIDNVGNFYVTASLDRESTASYVLTVAATTITSGASAFALVNVTVLDMNEFAPQFSSSSTSTASLVADVPIGTVVARANAVDADAGINGLVRYSLPASLAGKFTVHPYSGVVRTCAPLAEPSGSATFYTLSLTITATDSALTPLASSTLLNVTVWRSAQANQSFAAIANSNINAVGPFNMSYNVSDNSFGATFPAACPSNAVALYAPSNGFMYYIVSDLSASFYVDPDVGSLRLLATPNAAVTVRYTVLVQAQSRDFVTFPRIFLNCIVLVSVVAASNPPTFDFTGYAQFTGTPSLTPTATVSGTVGVSWIVPASGPLPSNQSQSLGVPTFVVPENAPVGYVAFQAYALSLDNLALTYSLGEVQPLAYATGSVSIAALQFTVDPQLGVVRLALALDFEATAAYVLNVRCTDSLGRAATAAFVINVANVPDTLPSFVTVASNVSTANWTLGINYALAFTPFVRVPLAYVVATNPESTPLYYTLASCPSFNESTCPVQVDTSTGLLSLWPALVPSGGISTLALTIATSSYYPPLYTVVTQSLSIVFNNANDARLRAQFTAAAYSLSVAGSPTSLALAASAPVQNGVALSYAIPLTLNPSFASLNGQLLPYTVLDPVGGILTVNVSANATVKGTYYLPVVVARGSSLNVSTGASTQLSAIDDAALVQVSVGSATPQPPTFAYTSYQFYVPEMMGYMSNLVTIPAALSSGPAGPVFYELFGLDWNVNTNVNAPSLYVFANLLNGTLSSTRLNYQVSQQLTYSLVAFNGYVPLTTSGITASSLQSALPSSTVNITINVIDRNDCAPMFIVPGVPTWQYTWTYPISVPSNASVGTVLMRVQAHDNDTGLMGTVQFTLADASNLRFGIQPTDGSLYIAQPLDRLGALSPQLTYSLSVLAADLSPYNSLTSTATIQVTIVPTNQYAPQFVSQPYSSIILSDSPTTAGSVVGQLTVAAVDIDALVPANNVILLSVVNSSGPSILQFNTSSGQFYFSQNVSANTFAICRFFIRATEVSYSPNLSTVTAVQLVITPSSQVSAVGSLSFSSAAYYASALESSPSDTMLLRVSAQSSSVQSAVQYSLFGSSASMFSLDPVNGTLVLLGSLSYALAPSYTLLVSAQFTSNTLRQTNSDAFATITIVVNQTNSYAPVFLQSGYNASLLEGLPGGTAVVRVRAYSPLASQNANLTYSLRVGDTQQFQFDPSSPGLIRSVIQLNYQTASNYLLIAQVTDNQSPPRTATCSIAVRVIDTNSNSPTFPSISFTATLSESTIVGTRVGAYSATDLDLDPPLSYSIVNASLRVGSSGTQYPAANFFSISAFSAELFIVGSLTPLLADPPALTRTLSLGLVANNSPFSASTSILVTITTDYSLHSPSCDSSVRHVSIAQSVTDAQTVTISTDAIGSSPAAVWTVSVASTPLLQLANITVLNQAYFSLLGSQALTYTLLTLTSNFSLSGNVLFVNWPAILAASSNILIAVQVTYGQTGASCIEYLLINVQLTGSANILTSTSSSTSAVSVNVATPPGSIRARSVVSASYQLFAYQLALTSSTPLTYSSYTVAKTVVVNPLSGELLVSGSAPAFYAPFYVSIVRFRAAVANLTVSATPLSGGALTALGNGPLAVSASVQQLELNAPRAPTFLGGSLPCSGGAVPQLVVATGAASVATRLFAANQPSSFVLASNSSLLLNSSLCSVNISAATTYVLTQYDATWLASSLSNYQTVAVAAPGTVSLSLSYMQSFIPTATAAAYPAAYTFYVSTAARNGTSVAVLPIALNVSYPPFITPTPVVAPTYTYYALSNPQAQSACIDTQSARLTVCGAMPAAGTNLTIQAASFGPLSSQLAAVNTITLRMLPGSSRAPTFSASNYSFGLPSVQQLSAGAVIGQIGASTTEQDPVTGLVYYSFQQSTPYFTINATTGVIQVTQALVDLVNGQASTTTAPNRRRRRQAATTLSSVTVTAQAGSLLTDASVTTVPVSVQLAPASSGPSSSSSNNTLIIAIVVPVSVVVIAVIILIVLIFTKKLRLPKKHLADANEHNTPPNGATTENGQLNPAYEAGGFDPVVRSNLDQPYMRSATYGTEPSKSKAASISSAEPIAGAVHTAAIVQQADTTSRTTIASRNTGAPQPQLQNIDGLSRSSRAVSGPSAGGRVGSPPSASVSSSQPVSLPHVMPVFLAAQQQGKPKTGSQPDSGILEAFATGSASSSQQRAGFRSGSASSSQQLATPFDNASHLDYADEDDAVLAHADLNDLSRSRDCYEYLQKLGISTDLSAYANAPPASTGLTASTSNAAPGRPTNTQNGPNSRSGSHESASATTSENNSDREALRRAGHELLAGAGSGGAMIKDSEILLAPTPTPFLFEPDMLANLNLAPSHTQSGPDRGPTAGLNLMRSTAGSRQNDNISQGSSQRHASASQQSDTPNRLGTTSPSHIVLSGRPDASRSDSLMTSPTGLDAQSVIGFPDVGWMPCYQDLAQVFSQIAKLPSDTVAAPFAGLSFTEGDELSNGGFVVPTSRELPRNSPSAYALNGIPPGQPSAPVGQPSRLYSGSSTRSGTTSVSSVRTGASSGMQIPLRNLATSSASHQQHMLLGNLNGNSAASRIEDTLEEMEI